MDQVKAVFAENHTDSTEQTYDIYLLPPGEDPESCQSYLRMRNKDGKYSLMFEVCSLKFEFSCFYNCILTCPGKKGINVHSEIFSDQHILRTNRLFVWTCIYVYRHDCLVKVWS